MAESDERQTLDWVRRERDLYLRLLELGNQNQVEPFLKDALALVVETTGANQGYLELRDEGVDDQDAWWLAHGCSDAQVDTIRSQISRGIIAEALATGRTIETPSAWLDERFRDRKSVQLRRIEAVLCAPVGESATLGVLYLQGSEPFSEGDRARAELFARHLVPLADRLIARRRIARETDPTHDLRTRYRLEGIVGRSSAFAAALKQAMLGAPLEVNVLLTGASGTGKSQLARAIHDNSPRAGGPFVELNCAALPEALIESELFGARAGSHSEARRNVAGKVEAAEGGTLFLDEVGELPRSAQAKLLQLLQSRQYYPLGETRPVTANVRVIAATNADLEQAVREKGFREDLFYRLQVLPVRLPSLSERREDVRELARALCERVALRHGLVSVELTPGAMLRIEAAEWPGNVRQLENVIAAGSIRAAEDDRARIEARHLFPDEAGEAGSDPEPVSFQGATRVFQRQLLERTLEETDWNVSETARRLDLARSHVYNLIRGFGLERRDTDT